MKKLIIIFSALLFLGCNSATNNKTTGAPSDNASASTPKTKEAAPSSSAGSEISVTLTGGANAGVYHVISKETTCSEGLTGDNSFGNQYSEKGKADNELSSVQLIIDNKDAALKGTDKFYLKVAFGQLLKGKSYEINGGTNFLKMAKSGSGKATLTETGGTKTVVIEGKTADGVGISATLTCKQAMTPNGIQ